MEDEKTFENIGKDSYSLNKNKYYMEIVEKTYKEDKRMASPLTGRIKECSPDFNSGGGTR